MTGFLQGATRHVSDNPRGRSCEFSRLANLSPARLDAIPSECWPDGLMAKVKAEQKADQGPGDRRL